MYNTILAVKIHIYTYIRRNHRDLSSPHTHYYIDHYRSSDTPVAQTLSANLALFIIEY